MKTQRVTIWFDEAPQGFTGTELKQAINQALKRAGFKADNIEVEAEDVCESKAETSGGELLADAVARIGRGK